MRPTWAWLFALLAIGIPVFLVGALRASGGEGLGVLILAIIVLVFSLFAFVGFGAIALILAKPSSTWGRIGRRIALGLLGFMCLNYGVGSLLYIMEYPESIVLLGMGLLLLPLGLAALYALWRDIRKKVPVTHEQTRQ